MKSIIAELEEIKYYYNDKTFSRSAYLVKQIYKIDMNYNVDLSEVERLIDILKELGDGVRPPLF